MWRVSSLARPVPPRSLELDCWEARQRQSLDEAGCVGCPPERECDLIRQLRRAMPRTGSASAANSFDEPWLATAEVALDFPSRNTA